MQCVYFESMAAMRRKSDKLNHFKFGGQNSVQYEFLK